MRIGVYPGSFDPVTNGHLDIINRSSKLVDKLIVSVLKNSQKKSLFSTKERVELLKDLTKDMDNVEITSFSGLLVDFMKQEKADVIIRGFRAVSDYELEMQLAQTNYSLCPDIETIFLVTRVEYSFLSSSIVKEVARYGGNVSHMVPEQTIKYLEKKFDLIKRGNEEF
jgi:pantetheine-phosphate adenylyltransferase